MFFLNIRKAYIKTMKVITSKDNKIYKQCLSLTSKKYRDKLNLYLVEGEKLVKEAYDAGMVETIILDAGYSKGIHFQGVDIVFMMGKLFEKLAQTETSQGILAIVRKSVYGKEKFQEIVGKDHGNVVILDRLQDPGNIGTIIRTADAAGYKGLVAIKGTGDVYSPKVVRAAAGSVLRLPMIVVKDEEEALTLLKECGKTVIGTAFNTDRYFYDVDLTKNIGLVVGNEGNGMSDYFIENTDFNIKIPMQEPVDSLNAAVAAGILMYQSKGRV